VVQQDVIAWKKKSQGGVAARPAEENPAAVSTPMPKPPSGSKE
jgi:hypothetical protein